MIEKTLSELDARARQRIASEPTADGRVAMANAGPNTSDCQFFITTNPATSLDDVKVVQKLVSAPRDKNDRPRTRASAPQGSGAATKPGAPDLADLDWAPLAGREACLFPWCTGQRDESRCGRQECPRHEALRFLPSSEELELL
jgi:hypothetical protein